MKVGNDEIAGLAFPTSDDPAELGAWYSGFAWNEHMRKVLLASCREIVRAEYNAKGVKISEARIDDLARNHWAYGKFLATHLLGRIKWEREKMKQGLGA